MDAAQSIETEHIVRTRTYKTYQTALFAVLYLCLATLLIYLAFSNWSYDDPFIIYRYAQNLATGNGFVYNPGERVLSTTTPLFTMLLAVIYPLADKGHLLWKDLPQLANLLGAFCLALGGWFIWDLAHTWKQPARLSTTVVGLAGLLLYPTFPLVIRTLGSETPLYLALCLGTFAFYARRSYNLAAILAALAVLTRPDGALVPAILALDYLVRVRRPIPWSAICIFGLLTLPWFIFSWSYFGSPVPATLAAKQAQGAMAISQRFAPGLLTVMMAYTQKWYFWAEAILAALGLIWVLWRARQWSLLLSWTILYFLAYTVLGVSRYYWYYAPLVPGFIAAAGLGAAGVCTVAVERTEKKRRLKAQNDPARLTPERPLNSIAWLAYLPLIAILAIALGQFMHLRQIQPQTDARIAAYQAAGEWIKENTPAAAHIATLEIGAIGYYSGRPVIDFAGLIQPEVAAQIDRETTYADLALWAVKRYHPEYLVLHEGIFPDLEQGYAAQFCNLVKSISGASFGYNRNLEIYDCLSPLSAPVPE